MKMTPYGEQSCFLVTGRCRSGKLENRNCTASDVDFFVSCAPSIICMGQPTSTIIIVGSSLPQ
ncbi:hypothetical protein HanIR_Chr01g0006971 [Helianthus annuus]|nr:hypothetical protein HanIR_Chr01g0006971 [Helianthus annuus]